MDWWLRNMHLWYSVSYFKGLVLSLRITAPWFKTDKKSHHAPSSCSQALRRHMLTKMESSLPHLIGPGREAPPENMHSGCTGQASQLTSHLQCIESWFHHKSGPSRVSIAFLGWKTQSKAWSLWLLPHTRRKSPFTWKLDRQKSGGISGWRDAKVGAGSRTFLLMAGHVWVGLSL